MVLVVMFFLYIVAFLVATKTKFVDSEFETFCVVPFSISQPGQASITANRCGASAMSIATCCYRASLLDQPKSLRMPPL